MLRGALAGAAGTAAMDLFWRARVGARGDTDDPRAGDVPAAASRVSRPAPPGDDEEESWTGEDETGEWSLAPAPAQVGRQFYEGCTQKTLEARFARVTGALVHWGYGMWWGGLFGLVATSGRRSRVAWGPVFGATVWGTSYLLLPLTGLYRPVWEYRAAELAPDLAAHLIYGTGVAAVFAVLDRDLRGDR